jgi:hypothetical protein
LALNPKKEEITRMKRTRKGSAVNCLDALNECVPTSYEEGKRPRNIFPSRGGTKRGKTRAMRTNYQANNE